jgi:hypothetical protein
MSIIDDAEVERAREAAEKAIEYLSPDQAWALLTERIVEFERHEQETFRMMNEIEQLGHLLAPGVAAKTWKAAFRDSKRPIEGRIHELRVAAALAADIGEVAKEDPWGPFKRPRPGA